MKRRRRFKRPEVIDLRKSYGSRRFAAVLCIARFHKAAHRLNRRTSRLLFGDKLESGLDGRIRKYDW
jgi:hypothetical protein